MVAPVIAMVGISAASGIAQFLNSERGRRMAKEERARLEGLINKLEAPEFDTAQLTPPELKVLETYTPEVAQLVYEVDPELITADSDRAIQGKQAQDAALSQFQAIARGDDPLGDVEIVRAINDAIENSGSQRNAILADMARKGVSPSASAYSQLQFQNAGQSQKNMFDASLNAAVAERQRRDQALGNSANLGGKILGFETDLEKMNDQIINSINQRNTQARRQYLTNRANTLNDAQKYNIGERQRISEANLNNIYKSQQRAQDLRNKQIGARYQTDRDKLNLLVGNARFPEITETTQGRNQAIQGIGDAAMMGAMLSARGSTPKQQAGGGGGSPQYMMQDNNELILR